MSANLRERLDELPANLANHLEISVIALIVGVVLTVPLAVLLTRRKRLRYPILTVAGVIQTIPSLALLALMVPLIAYTNGFGLGISAFGFYPAVIALTLYSTLPILRNTVTGILGVDAALIEAARGMGMTDRQVLWKVQLPLAAPVIIAGIRTATMWVVGIATLATPVGQKCLGNYIFTGLQTRNWLMVWFGVIAAAALAVLLDLLIGGVEKATRERRRPLAWLSGSSLAALLVIGLVAPSLARWVRSSAGAAPVSAVDDERAPRVREVTIGAKTFTEQYILSSLIARELGEHGIETTVVDSLGSTVVFDALVRGNVDVYVDYSGTIWANHMKRTDTPPAWHVLAEVEAWLAREHGIRSLGSLGFENAYVLAMRRSHAERLGIRSIADLAFDAGSLRAGGDYEFFGRPEWAAIRDAYRLRFEETTSMDSTLMYEALAAREVDVISAFSSDGRVVAYDLLELADPEQVIPPYDAVLLLGPRVADQSVVVQALAPLIGAIRVETMQRANHMVDRDRDKLTPRQAADWLGSQIGR